VFRSITGKRRRITPNGDLIACELNKHYAAETTDLNYSEPTSKHSCLVQTLWPTEEQVFVALDKLKPTATGLDALPSWMLKLASPSIAKPLAHIFNLSLNQSTPPTQWNTACISPVPKVPLPATCSDYRPISLTPILSRVF
jgi:hypothetical protein